MSDDLHHGLHDPAEAVMAVYRDHARLSRKLDQTRRDLEGMGRFNSELVKALKPFADFWESIETGEPMFGASRLIALRADLKVAHDLLFGTDARCHWCDQAAPRPLLEFMNIDVDGQALYRCADGCPPNPNLEGG